MSYERTIRYLEYLENGEKTRSVGFVKIEAVDQLCNVQIHVTGLHPTESCAREVRFLGYEVNASAPDSEDLTEGIFGTVSIQDGKGSLIKKRVSTAELCEGISYDSLQIIRINLGKNREAVCRWREGNVKQVQLSEPENSSEDMPSLRREEPEVESRPSRRQEPEVEARPSRRQEPEAESQPAGAATDQIAPQPVNTAHRTSAPVMPPTLKENKWRQLSEIYPHIAPFHDDRDYLSIGPGDFVILPQKYYRLVSNSFLLHGYYNYGHLILARTMKRGEEVFYLGVPGNFFERERQVAIMFGFESFECRQEPADEGVYGYYMIRVEL